jgi:uncharacterized protein (TIGR03437 family)
MIRLALVALAGAGIAAAYVPGRAPNGAPLARPDFNNVQFYVNDAIAPGMRASDGVVIVTADSDPVAALEAAAASWSTISLSAIRFAPLQRTPISRDQGDGRSVFSFGDSPELQSVVGSAIGVTLMRFRGDGTLLDTDIVFNADLNRSGRRVAFSTTLAPGTFDLQSVATHELGHALGANHSGLIGAAMYQATVTESDAQRRLSADDEAFAAETYPAPGSQGRLGAIAGRITFQDGAPVRRASVVAVGRGAGAMVQTLTLEDGSYRIGGLPPGEYDVYTEPVDGPVRGSNLGLSDSELDTHFITALGSPVHVEAGTAADAFITVTTGRADVDIELAGLFSDNLFGAVATRTPLGTAADILLFGRGLDADSEILVLGSGISLRHGSVRIEPSLRISGMPAPLRLTVDVSTEARDLATILVRRNDVTVAWSGGLQAGAGRPSFAASGVVNAASFLPGAVAPGELVSIFGTALGPVTPMALRALDPLTGRVPVSLGGVSVSFDGIAAPLLYVSATQVNAQVPYEIAGRLRASVVVSSQGVPGAAVSVPVVDAAPGVFAVANEDGRVNSPTAPVARGRAIVVYATGGGVVDPPIATGTVAPISPLRSAGNVTATVGGVPAVVLFGGLTPDFAGLLQVNLIVPEGAPTGDAVPVVIGIQGQRSQTGKTIAVR